MSNSRQGPLVRSYSITHPPGLVSLPTQPGWDLVLFAHSGLFTARADSQAWAIPAHRALCIPDGTLPLVETTRRSGIRCLYLDRGLDVLDAEVRVINLHPLTRELLSHAIRTAPMYLDEPADTALITVLADQLTRAPDVPLHLPIPVDATAAAVADAVMADPATGLDHHLRSVGANRRTMERRFESETRMSLGQWRRRARILAAVGMLAEGDSVTRVALRVGYASPSSFIVAFRAELDQSPREFMRHDSVHLERQTSQR